MNISTINTPAFNAKMDISKVTRNKEHWEKVAKSFETKTKKDTLNHVLVQDSLAVKYNGNATFACSTIDKKGQQAGIMISCDAKTLDKLNNENPANVADKLVQLYKMGKSMSQKDVKACNKTFDLYKKYEKVCPSFESLLDKFYYPHKELLNADAANKISKTPELNGFKIII